jgi:hypothetical protein
MQAVLAEIAAALREAELRAAQLPPDSVARVRAGERVERLRRLHADVSTSGHLSAEAARDMFSRLLSEPE